MAISPDGKTMYLPSFEKNFWNVVDCNTGDIIKKIEVHKRAHNTIYGPSGKYVYLDDIASPWLYVADAKKHELVNKVGPFANFVRPFTINGRETLVYATVDSLLGFEVGDLSTGKKLAHVEVEGWNMGPVRRHGNPSHGIALTPDEKELWVANAQDASLSIVDTATKKVVETLSVPFRSANRLKFTPDGKLVLVSDLGDGKLIILDAATRREIKRIDVGGGAAGIQMAPDGARAFVAVGSQNGVAVIDLKTLSVSARIETGPGPDGLAWVK